MSAEHVEQILDAQRASERTPPPNWWDEKKPTKQGVVS
jgi:hypothetical protein